MWGGSAQVTKPSPRKLGRANLDPIDFFVFKPDPTQKFGLG
jgi:hypothetical protein